MGFKFKKVFRAVARSVNKIVLKPAVSVAKNKLVQTVARAGAAYATGGTSELYLQSAKKAQDLLKSAKSSTGGQIASEVYSDIRGNGDVATSSQIVTPQVLPVSNGSKRINSKTTFSKPISQGVSEVFSDVGRSLDGAVKSVGGKSKMMMIAGGAFVLIVIVILLGRKK